MTVAIDGMCLGRAWAGTQSVTLETIRALSSLLSDSEGSLTVLHSPAITAQVASIIDDLPNVMRVRVDDMRADATHPADVVYRPYQVSTVEELRWLRRRGRRVVVNQLDLIAWSNPSYLASEHAWLSQRELTRLTLATVDGVAFISDFVRREVETEQLIPPHTPKRVVHCGTSSVFDGSDAACQKPDGMPDDGRPFLFVLGASYHHKNRVFAVKLLSELRQRGWNGDLVLAGPTPPRGNSLGDESLANLRNSSIADHVITLGDLRVSEKAWMYSRAALSLYPTCSEGFGLIPFESALHGVPILSSRQGSLDEVLPAGIITLDGYDVSAAADQAWQLLHDPAIGARQCAEIVDRAHEFTWDRTARELLELFEQTLRQGRNNTEAIWGEGPAPASIDVIGEPPSRHYSSIVEHQIQRLLELETLKRAAIPDGSRRQDAARRSANWARRTSRRI